MSVETLFFKNNLSSLNVRSNLCPYYLIVHNRVIRYGYGCARFLLRLLFENKVFKDNHALLLPIVSLNCSQLCRSIIEPAEKFNAEIKKLINNLN